MNIKRHLIPTWATLYQVLFFYKFDNIIYTAIQCITKSIQGFGADCFSFFDSIQGIGGKTLLKN